MPSRLMGKDYTPVTCQCIQEPVAVRLCSSLQMTKVCRWEATISMDQSIIASAMQSKAKQGTVSEAKDLAAHGHVSLTEVCSGKTTDQYTLAASIAAAALC